MQRSSSSSAASDMVTSADSIARQVRRASLVSRQRSSYNTDSLEIPVPMHMMPHFSVTSKHCPGETDDGKGAGEG